MGRVVIAAALFVSLSGAGLTAASEQHFVYVVTSNQQFGTVNLATGAFYQIGPQTPEGQANLVWGADESLYSLTYSGNLETINPSTGQTTVIGPTGLGFNAFDLAGVQGNLYATDFDNNLYAVDRRTGAATLIRATGIPADPNVPFSMNPDGTINLCDETLYGFAGTRRCPRVIANVRALQRSVPHGRARLNCARRIDESSDVVYHLVHSYHTTMRTEGAEYEERWGRTGVNRDRRTDRRGVVRLRGRGAMADVGVVIHIGRAHRRPDAPRREGTYPTAATAYGRLGSHPVGSGAFLDLDRNESGCAHSGVSCPHSFGRRHHRRTVHCSRGADRTAGGNHVAIAHSTVPCD